jgi:acyl carrier protein
MTQNSSNSFSAVEQAVKQILAERGDAVPALEPATLISASGLDSLDIAALVVRLQEHFGFDPFADPNLREYPRTLGELAVLYHPQP